jgi:hypothetical protein
LSGAKLIEKFSQEVSGEQDSVQGSVLTPELMDFIQRIIVPILVERYLRKTKTVEHSNVLPRFVGDC